MSLAQRQPRVEDPAYLAYLRTLPCLICARPGPNDPAHLRSAALQYGKRLTGMAEKSDDRWALPLCRHHHAEQHRNNELRWWARYGIPDPFAVAMNLYASRPASRPQVERPRKAPKVRVRKPAAERAKVAAGRPLESRSTFPPGRPITGRNNLRRREN